MRNRPFPTILLAARLRRLALVPLLLVLAGCGVSAMLIGRFADPEVTLDESKVESLSPSVATVLFGLDVYNPNPYALRLHDLRYRLSVNGVRIAEGAAAQGLVLPARASAKLHLV